MSVETIGTVGAVLAAAVSVIVAMWHFGRALRKDLKEDIATVAASVTDLAKTVASNHDKALAATEKARDELRGEAVEIRRQVASLADRLFDETPRARTASG